MQNNRNCKGKMFKAGYLLLLEFSLDAALCYKSDFKINQVQLQERFFQTWTKNPSVSLRAFTLKCKSNAEWEWCQIKSPSGKNCSLHRGSSNQGDSNQRSCQFGNRAINLHVVKAIRHRYLHSKPPQAYFNKRNIY